MNDCICLDAEGEPCELSVVSSPVARKEYRCSECSGVIRRGDTYELWKGRCRGEFFRQRTCRLCVEIATALYCGGRTGGTLWLDIEEQLFSEGLMNSACLDKLTTPEAKQFLQQRWWAWVERQQ